jgi:hypothetical protein
VDGIVLVLEQVRAGFLAEAVAVHVGFLLCGFVR